VILVTGATGLIGSHLTCKLLLEGRSVSVLRRKESSQRNIIEVAGLYSDQPEILLSKLKWIEGDVTDIFSLIDAMQGIDEVYHCAGFVSFDARDSKKLMSINSEGTANAINAALECGVSKFCHVSSVATLPNHDNKPEINESIYWKSSPLNSLYAISKYGGEREAWRGVEEGLNVVIVNPSVVIGPGCWGQSSSRLIDECHKGISVFTDGTTGYVDVRDVADSMIMLMNKNCFGQRYILSSENMNFRTIFDLFHEQFSRPKAKYNVGKNVLTLGRWFDSLYCRCTKTERRLTKDVVRAALDKNYYSSTKVSGETGIKFIPVKDSIQFTAQAYLRYVNHKAFA
jgi:dihydroflavonol-4-reductase